jgi:hypothetical protein
MSSSLVLLLLNTTLGDRMKLTPFEEAAIERQRHLIFVAAVEATQAMKELSDECGKQIDHYRWLLLMGDEGAEERAALRDVTARAMKDNKKCNKVFTDLANALEDNFGISA